ncbi:MAG: UPF0755 protein [Candidatus Berkelbacteria bacterium Licking1014_85]|uniref:Endolytic murein transglycosylase n=1 Tax=Candidatus Berkelbacteria bacterium Licking1014_85 TaxID=2017148 RepID=A0A554LK97_9BACT|nr:MAG: UPF0755 protein [Candidatus Berkelbacteria bacterium Licking1014_85]
MTIHRKFLLYLLLFLTLFAIIFSYKIAKSKFSPKTTTTAIPEKTITIIEGWRREQIAQLLDKNNLVAYADFMENSQNLEGKLFPDTYRFFAATTADEVIKKMTDNYTKKVANLNISQDDLILASIIEREAKFDEDRPKIAGVYNNRLKINMALEADPTVQYAIEINKDKDFSYWQQLSAGNIQFKSAYNTYLNTGLPPNPICNPGSKSLQAAKNPEKHNYYYFLNTADGKTYYSKTKSEHDKLKRELL